MSQCIKCGKNIPDGELFCPACSLNPTVSMLDEGPSSRPAAPKGRMQTPRRVDTPVPAPVPSAKVQKSGRGALMTVSLLLVLTLGYLAWQYGSIGAAKYKLWSKEKDLAVRENELATLQATVDDLQQQLDDAHTVIAAKDLELEELAQKLSGSQSSQSQASYDLTTKEEELDRLMTENQQLADLTDQLEEEAAQLKQEVEDRDKALEAAAQFKTKADFMDSYVVFVENNGTGYYHTYDCEDFSRSSFWAYSRKLAESNGYRPCPTCGGKIG